MSIYLQMLDIKKKFREIEKVKEDENPSNYLSSVKIPGYMTMTEFFEKNGVFA